MGTQPGPCIHCGQTDYPLSYGGPNICPACDCEPFGGLRGRIRQLERQLTEREAALLAEVAAFLEKWAEWYETRSCEVAGELREERQYAADALRARKAALQAGTWRA